MYIVHMKYKQAEVNGFCGTVYLKKNRERQRMRLVKWNFKDVGLIKRYFVPG